jgi:hypothetical protein
MYGLIGKYYLFQSRLVLTLRDHVALGNHVDLGQSFGASELKGHLEMCMKGHLERFVKSPFPRNIFF